MKKIVFLISLITLIASCGGGNPPSNITDKDKVLAFPHAEGGGKYTTGGRGGSVYHITNLEDNAKTPGSLRWAVSQPGTKTIVFDICGVIHLSRELDITEGNLTIAGQSAPGDGICIADFPVNIKTSNVIIRFVHFRMGDLKGAEGDALSISGRKDIIVDHCSFSWSTDECVSCYGNTNFTLQYCFITESLNNSVHAKGAHGYGGIWGGTNASFHHNLMAHHNSRTPRFDHDYVDSKARGPLDFVNNVVYNWGGNSAYGGEGNGTPRQINFEANFFKPGPASKDRTRLLNPTTKCSNCTNCPSHTEGPVVPGRFYIANNKMDGSGNVTSDNWQGVKPDEASKLDQCRADARWEEGLILLTKVQTAEDAFETVLTSAGASLHRDVIDTRIVAEVRNGNYTYKGSNGSTNGLIDTPSDCGGWPEYKTAERPTDSDADGIPDEWELANGLDPHAAKDARLVAENTHYTNLERYLNSLVEHLY